MMFHLKHQIGLAQVATERTRKIKTRPAIE